MLMGTEIEKGLWLPKFSVIRRQALLLVNNGIVLQNNFFFLYYGKVMYLYLYNQRLHFVLDFFYKIHKHLHFNAYYGHMHLFNSYVYCTFNLHFYNSNKNYPFSIKRNFFDIFVFVNQKLLFNFLPKRYLEHLDWKPFKVLPDNISVIPSNYACSFCSLCI